MLLFGGFRCTEVGGREMYLFLMLVVKSARYFGVKLCA